MGRQINCESVVLKLKCAQTGIWSFPEIEITLVNQPKEQRQIPPRKGMRSHLSLAAIMAYLKLSKQPLERDVANTKLDNAFKNAKSTIDESIHPDISRNPWARKVFAGIGTNDLNQSATGTVLVGQHPIKSILNFYAYREARWADDFDPNVIRFCVNGREATNNQLRSFVKSVLSVDAPDLAGKDASTVVERQAAEFDLEQPNSGAVTGCGGDIAIPAGDSIGARVSPGNAANSNRHPQGAVGMVTDLPDILTPGSLAAFGPECFAKPFPPGSLARLTALGEDGVVAVEEGDFSAHITIGAEILREAMGIHQLQSAGHYFAAEGYRLQEGLEDDPARKRQLLDRSLEHYMCSSDFYPGSSRALRGLARVLEVGGDLDKALDAYTRAKGMTIEKLHSPLVHFERPLLHHEILRITRHTIHCIIEMRATSPSSKWLRANKESELEGYLVESQNFHEEYLPAFRFRRRWHCLEWFMAYVFFGKVWSDLGNSFQMIAALLKALTVRRLIMTSGKPLTQIERANLKWWLNVATSGDRISIWRDMAPRLDKLETALALGSNREILRCVDDLISCAGPSWEPPGSAYAVDASLS